MIIAKKKIIGWVLNINPMPKRDAEIITLDNLIWFFVMKYTEQIARDIGARSFNEDMDNIPTHGLNAINNWLNIAIL